VAVLCDACADIVFFGIDLHDFKNPSKVFSNARECLQEKRTLCMSSIIRMELEFSMTG
jgi:hypothetical protein